MIIRFGKQKHKQRHKRKGLNMKKTMMRLAVTGLVLACATAVFAATMTSVFVPFDYLPFPDNETPLDLTTEEGGIHANAHGYVTFKTSRSGGVDVTVQLWDAAKSYTYSVQAYGAGGSRHEFTTNKRGYGGLQFHVKDARTLGQWINIYSAHTQYYPQGWPEVAATPGVTVHLWYAYNSWYAGN